AAAPFDGGAVEGAAAQIDGHVIGVGERERPDPVVAAGFDDRFGFDDGLHDASGGGSGHFEEIGDQPHLAGGEAAAIGGDARLGVGIDAGRTDDANIGR